MLSYRHAFHAGNHADALKHLVLTHVLQHAVKKDKPLWYIDTHAGAGKYALDQGYATKNAEFADGIARLWNDPQLTDCCSSVSRQPVICQPAARRRCMPRTASSALKACCRRRRAAPSC